MENLPETKDYLKSLSEEDFKNISALMVKRDLGILSLDNDNNGDTCSGCTPTTINGGCYVVNGTCQWIPAT